jgi:hypothetical protein
LADANGNIVLRNARPGELGTLGLRPIEGPGRWDLDANLQKSIRIRESKSVTFRMDAQNIFNHPNVGPFICRQLIQRLDGLELSSGTPTLLNSRFQLFRNEVSGTVTPYQMIFELVWPPTSGLPTSR